MKDTLNKFSTYANKDDEIKNKEFNQYTLDGQQLLIQLTLEDATARAVFDILTLNMNKNNTTIIKQETIAKAIHKDKRTIKRSIKTLEENGFLQILKYGRTNIYFINPFICYCCTGALKKHFQEVYINLWKQEHDDGDKVYKPNKDIFDVEALNSAEKVDYKLVFKQFKQLALPEFGELARENEIMQSISYLGLDSKEKLANILEMLQYNETDKTINDLWDYTNTKKEDESISPQPETTDNIINEDSYNFENPPMDLSYLEGDELGFEAEEAQKLARKAILKERNPSQVLTNS